MPRGGRKGRFGNDDENRTGSRALQLQLPLQLLGIVEFPLPGDLPKTGGRPEFQLTVRIQVVNMSMNMASNSGKRGENVSRCIRVIAPIVAQSRMPCVYGVDMRRRGDDNDRPGEKEQQHP